MPKKPDLARTVSRHTLSYMLCSISEMFRHYRDFDPLDLLIVHAILNANVIGIMKRADLDSKFRSVLTVEPEEMKEGVSRAALSRFLGLPIETIRRRVVRLKGIGVLFETGSGLVVSQANKFKFGNNHKLQKLNMVLVKKLFLDLRRNGINGPGDL